MIAKIRCFLIGLLYANNEPSLTQFIIAVAFLLFCGVSLYLVIMQVHWDNYGTFATITGGGSMGCKIADRVTTIVSGSPPGQMPGPKNGSC